MTGGAMRFFDLLNFQHVILYVFPTIVFVIVFGLGLKFSRLKTARDEEKMTTITGRYPEDIEERNAPFPVVLILIIAGTLAWAFFYILMHGLLEVKI